MNQNYAYPSEQQESGAKKFWRIVLGSMLGVILSGLLCCFLSLIFIISIAAGTESSPVVKDNSILKLSLSTSISERAISSPFDNFEIEGLSNLQTGLDDILKCIKSAATDPKIKGIYIQTAHIQAAPATVQEIRDALLEFKESGKFIYAYSDVFANNGYYLATVADKIALNPLGSIDFKGMAGQVLFYKGLLDKLEIEMQVIRHGSFKSAVEPYILDKMSEANRLQMSTLFNSIWDTELTHIEKSRHISKDSLNYIADNLLCNNAENVLQHGLVDQLSYYADVEKELKTMTGIDENEDLRFISISDYKKSVVTLKTATNKIAVVYAVGEIIDGKGNDQTIGSVTLSKDIRKAYKNSNVKAIVLRVNSPGGSALASDIIWNEIELAKQAGKKIVVSMGDYAASGGYYISCGADLIVSQPNTLTGSIGVFGLVPNVQKFLKNKLGVTVDVVNTNKHADYMTGFRALDPTEAKIIQIEVDEIYNTFVSKVAAGRNMAAEDVDKIGEGRVWSGKDALEIGLVDKLGTLNDAIVEAAKLANIDSYGIEYYPAQKEWWMTFLNQDKNTDAAIKAKLGELYFINDAYQQIINSKGTQARMPFEIMFE